MTITFIRIILSLALIYGVYTETGMFTAIAIFLILLDVELRTKLRTK